MSRAFWREKRRAWERAPSSNASRCCVRGGSLAREGLGDPERAAEAGHREVEHLLPEQDGVRAIRRRCDQGPVGPLRRHAVDDPAVDGGAGQGVEAGDLPTGEMEDVLVEEDSAAIGLPAAGPVRGRDAVQTFEEDVDRLEREGKLELELLRPGEGALDGIAGSATCRKSAAPKSWFARRSAVMKRSPRGLLPMTAARARVSRSVGEGQVESLGTRRGNG